MRDNQAASRRQFIKQSALIGATLPFGSSLNLADFSDSGRNQNDLQVYLFSKHLQFLDYEDMAKAAKDIGFDGLELTVREGGHVDPENVTDQLPKAVEAVKNQGLNSDLMVSDITRLNDRSKKVLQTAADLGIKKYRMGYYDYPDDISMPEAIEKFTEQGKEIAQYNQDLGIHGMHQNHAGGLVGASLWEIWMLIEKIDPTQMGCQYDIRHAMVDGGYSWPNGLRLIKDRISTLAIKDYKWGFQGDEWEVINTPLGKGLVDFVDFFRTVKEYGINVPLSLHLEYDIHGAEHGSRSVPKDKRSEVYSAMATDLEYIRKCWNEA